MRQLSPTPVVFSGIAILLMITAAKVQAAESPSPAAEEETGGDASRETMQNSRMKTLDGSSSRWSGQFNLTYYGSSIDHPLSEFAPNPGHAVPPPLVTCSGTISTRYRLDDSATVGFGTGIATETPLQGQQHTTFADPYVDIAKTSKIGIFYNHVDLKLNSWTNHEYYKTYGYRYGLTGTNETFYEFKSGFTAGLALIVMGNTFAEGNYDTRQQTAYTIAEAPYLEYAFNRTFSFRTITGILDSHERNEDGTHFEHPDVYQQVGVGTAVTDAIYLYTYVQMFPYSDHPVTAQNTMFRMAAIVNLF